MPTPSRARHRAVPDRRPSVVDLVPAPRRALGLVAAAAVVGAPVLAAAPAQAADGSTWDRLAQCESSGDWAIDTGNGFKGGLQFTAQTWRGFGGGQYAATADQATRAEQIAVAEKVLDVQGWGAWPSCSRKLGLGSADKAGSVAAPAPRAAAAASKPAAAAKPASQPAAAQPAAADTSSADTDSGSSSGASDGGSGDQHTVVAGDTLAKIAAAEGTTWQAIWSANRGAVADPDLIYPGQVLSV